jgi:DNA polymerase III epsilon subunit-like protein
MPFDFPFKFVAIDLETTDLDPEVGSVIQIGAISINEDFQIIGQLETLIKPLDDHWSKKAQEVHKLTPEHLQKQGYPPLDALINFEGFTGLVGDQLQLASWGNYFDINFLRGYYKRVGRIFPFSHSSLDLKSIALWEMAKLGIAMNAAEGHGIESFLARLGLEFEGTPHNASHDIYNIYRVLNILRQGEFPEGFQEPEPALTRPPGRHRYRPRSLSENLMGRTIMVDNLTTNTWIGVSGSNEPAPLAFRSPEFADDDEDLEND